MEWDYNNPELAILGVNIHAFIWIFIGSRPYYEFSNGELHKNNPSNSMLSERKIKQ